VKGEQVGRIISIILGLLLVVFAFVAFLLIGRVLNPPPVQVVIATEDIPPFTSVTRSQVVVDSQILDPKVAQRYVLWEELGSYEGAVAIEPLYAGEPLTKMRLVTGQNAAAVKRLALGLQDKTQVAMVVPVTPKQIVGEISPGDYVDIIFGSGLQTFVPQTFQTLATPTPTPTPAQKKAKQEGTPQTFSGPLATYNLQTDINPPLAKTIFQRVPVLRVNHKRIPNPNFGTSLGGSGQSEPPFIKGEIESIVVLIPAKDQELLAFALNNGTIHVALVPGLVQPEDLLPLAGMTWPDFVERFRLERAIAPVYSVTDAFGLVATATPTPIAIATPTPMPTRKP